MKRDISIRGALCAAALPALLMVWGCGKHPDVTGTWAGTLDASSVDHKPGQTIRIVMTIHKEGDHFTATMSTPDEGPQVVPADSVEFKDSSLTMKVSKRLAVITADLTGDDAELHGNFQQKPYDLPFVLKKTSGSQ